MSAQYRLILLAVLICAAIFGVKTWEGHLIAKGDAQGAARVQAAWDRQEAERSATTAADNVLKFRNAERVAHETAQRETERQALAAGAAAAVRSLRDQLARLDARPDPYPAGDAGLAACAREATTARQLFGESAGAYQQLAAEAGRGNVGLGLWQLGYGSKEALSTTSYGDARAAHQSLVGDNGKPLVIRSSELWVPPSLEQEALEVVQAERLANGATNVMRNLSKVVVCPWLI